MKILTTAQMQRIDRLTTERYGVPSPALMENAGRAVVDFLTHRFAPLSTHKIVIVCGRGNNGGDGLVIARLLRDLGLDPRVVLLADPESLQGDAATNLKRLTESGDPEIADRSETWQQVLPTLADTTLLVDAILGTGLSRPVEGFLLEVIRDLNQKLNGASVVAVDLPSGMSADTGEMPGEHIRVDASVTFTAPKIAHVFPPACEHVGEWIVRQIGTPAEALAQDPELSLNLTCREDLTWMAAAREPDSHKGNFGHVLLVAGSVGKTGAAGLAANAALRSGVGLVTVATARSALPIVATLAMEFMTEPLPETESGAISLRALDYGRLDKIIEGKTVLAIGPGIGGAPETAELVRTLVNNCDLPIVLDADGLNAFAGCMSRFHAAGRTRVLTPHPGEMARLTGSSTKEIQANRLKVAREFAAAYQVCLVLKGHRTLTAAPDGEIWVNPTGNPGMATGGTGDVLTGLTAGLLSAFHSHPLTRVVAGSVYLHGLAGDLAAQETGQNALIAGDLLRMIHKAFGTLAERPQ
jgi:NAD(P)H-hydrate epimerase